MNNYKKKPNRPKQEGDRVIYKTRSESKPSLAIWQKKLLVISKSMSMNFATEEDRTKYIKSEWAKLGK